MKFCLGLVVLAALPLAAQSTHTTSSPGVPSDGAPPAATNPASPAAFAAPAATNAAPDADTGNPSGIAGPPPSLPPSPDVEIPPPALSPDPFSDPLIVKIVARYEKAWQGDRKETKSLTADLERWCKDEPDNYLLMAYLGSVYALDSRDAWIGPGKLDYLHKGDKALDAAVSGDPSNPAVRLLRAINYYELPAVLGKHRAAHDDFEYLLAQLKGTLPMPFTLTNDSKQAIYYYAGLSELQFDQKEDAREAWETGLALDPKSKLGGKIQAELAKLK